eukprot:6708299-Pyramimonas_sp.AAC.1
MGGPPRPRQGSASSGSSWQAQASTSSTPAQNPWLASAMTCRSSPWSICARTELWPQCFS